MIWQLGIRTKIIYLVLELSSAMIVRTQAKRTPSPNQPHNHSFRGSGRRVSTTIILDLKSTVLTIVIPYRGKYI